MTKKEWEASSDSRIMFHVFGSPVGKFRLDFRLRRFAVECCRRVRHLISEQAFQSAVIAGEAFADDPQNKQSTIRVMAKAAIVGRRHLRHFETSANLHQIRAARAAIATCGPTDWSAACSVIHEAASALNSHDADKCDPAELRYQANLLRCLFGPLLFHSVTVDPSWLTPSATALAQTMYDTRDFAAMPILGDALEEAGCTNDDILSHCRNGKDHVRGCWVVDLVLGKE